MPTDEELVRIFLDAKDDRWRQGHSSSWDDNRAGVAAVRVAVIEALAAEAEVTDNKIHTAEDNELYGWHSVSGWLRAHIDGTEVKDE